LKIQVDFMLKFLKECLRFLKNFGINQEKCGPDIKHEGEGVLAGPFAYLPYQRDLLLGPLLRGFKKKPK
jgi:hypothetical protein